MAPKLTMLAPETIRFTLAAIKNAEIENRGPLTRGELLTLLQREAKRRQDSIEQFRAGGRADLVEREEAQLAVLKRYMPAELSDDELAELVTGAIAEAGATNVKELGKVMPIAMARAAGRADGKRISAVPSATNADA